MVAQATEGSPLTDIDIAVVNLDGRFRGCRQSAAARNLSARLVVNPHCGLRRLAREAAAALARAGRVGWLLHLEPGDLHPKSDTISL